ncbi:MAG: hypothetical protein H6610_11655 [Ignavibacteriales bacterium]|nr:hypothetical protein [Ignavibacteriales bacterium]MCB9220099.1 hypothetical protein [Ignavibacteriales bacterium]
MEIIKITGKYVNSGKIELENSKTVSWDVLSNENPPAIPFGSKLELVITFNEKDFLSGTNGFVWATYDLRQAEIIKETLLAQNIGSEIKGEKLGNIILYVIKILSKNEIEDAKNFIWKGDSGLRLKPDWNYKPGEINPSFEQWLSGN